jgi:hypothetical protein
LRELHAAQVKLQADTSLYVATGALSEKATDFARASQLELMGLAELARLLRTAAARKPA